MTRKAKQPSRIVRDLDVMSGAYCLRRTRIPVKVIKSRHGSGESIRRLASDYGVPIGDIKAALHFAVGSESQPSRKRKGRSKLLLQPTTEGIAQTSRFRARKYEYGEAQRESAPPASDGAKEK